MAYYIIPFCNLDGINYEVRIAKSGSDVTLIGAPHTIVVQEDDDDDMFKPVRTESGYIRIVDTGSEASGQGAFDWHDLIPTSSVSHRVELWNVDDNEVEWRGFLKPQTFQGELNTYPQEREFPVVGILNVLEAYDFDVTEEAPLNFGMILLKIFTEFPPPSVEEAAQRFIFQGEDVCSSQTVGWLYQRVSHTIFYSLDEDGNRKPKYNCLQMLEEFCKMFGFTARMAADAVWFVAPSQAIAKSGFTSLLAQDMNDIAHDISVQPSMLKFITSALPEAYTDTENTETVIPGVRKVTVKQDVGLINDNILQLPTDEILETFDDATGMSILVGSYGDNGRNYRIPRAPGYEETEPEQGSIIDTYTFDDFILTIPLYGDPQSQLMDYCRPRLDDWSDDVTNKIDFSWKVGLRVQPHEMGPMGLPSAILENRTARSYADGLFFLTANSNITLVKNGRRYTYNGAGTMLVALRVGNKYYSPSNNAFIQTDQPIMFNLPIGGKAMAEGEGSVPNTREFDTSVTSGYIIDDNPYPPYNGYGMPVGPGAVYGKLTLTIYNIIIFNGTDVFDNYMTASWYVDFTSLQIGFIRTRAAGRFTDKDTNEYTADFHTVYEGERSVDTIFATDAQNGFGNNILLSPSGGFVKTLPYTEGQGGSYEVPGQQLADEICAFYYKTHRILQLNQKMHMAGTTLPMQSKYTLSGNTYYPIAQTRDWQEDIITSKMIDL